MNEFDFIRQLREQTASRQTSTRIFSGIGDDAAVFHQSPDRDLVISTDLLVEGVDFHREATPPRLLGHKALAVSLSDIAAMGARPLWALVSIGLPEWAWASSFKDELFSGYLALADRYGISLAGGDISQSQQIVIDSIVMGDVKLNHAVLRSTAKPGDQIFVSGTLGAAAAGLKLIELGARVGTGGSDVSDDSAIQSLLHRQLAPQARVGWGIVLGEERLATSMIDLSDGLSSDLHHLCEESDVGAILDATQLPLDDDVKHLCGRRALDPLALALHGGEDFELLFTVNPNRVSHLPKRVDGVTISRIGEITEQPGTVQIREKNHAWDLPAKGFQHFSD